MGWFRRRNPLEPQGEAPVQNRDGADLDARARAEGYMSAEHKAASEAGKRSRRARTPSDSIDRARSLGMVSRAEYLTSEQEPSALQPGAAGLPDARLERVRDRLLVVTPEGWINPKSRTAHQHGLHSFQLQGTGHYAAAMKAGRFTPGALVRLVREPDNAHDGNAVAVYAERARSMAGYVPKVQARRLAPMLDAGVELVAVSTRGAGRGTEGTVPQILVCERRFFDHLTRS